MPYTPTTWVSTVTALDAAPMNNLETQHAQAVEDITRPLKPPTVRWVIPGWAWTSQLNTVVAANRIYYLPIYVPEDTNYDRIGINVQAGDGAGGAADLRIFEWDTGVPGDLILSAGTVSTNGAGAKEIVIAEALTRGWYFLAIRCDQAPTLYGSGIDRGVTAPVGGVAITNSTAGPNGTILYDDAAYADPAGAVDGVQTSIYTFVRLRES